MDCCYSSLVLNRSAGVWPGVSDFLRKISAMRVVQIITAGGQGEQVQERAGHGLFTSFYLEAIAGKADLDKDNVVTGTELGAYLRPTVSNASRQAQTEVRQCVFKFSVISKHYRAQKCSWHYPLRFLTQLTPPVW